MSAILFSHSAEGVHEVAEDAHDHSLRAWLSRSLDERVHHVDVAAVQASGMKEGCDEDVDHAAAAQS
jgi:hypothetical protein